MLSYGSATKALQAALFTISVAAAANPSLAAKTTECTKIAICYCVDDDLKNVIEAKVAGFREVLASERRRAKPSAT